MSRLVVAPPPSPFAPSEPVSVPGDKSIAHRALLLAARATTPSVVTAFPAGLDVAATRRCIEALGAEVFEEGSSLTIEPAPVARPAGEVTELDCANSGTTMRLLCGLLAGRPGVAVLDGDAS